MMAALHRGLPCCRIMTVFSIVRETIKVKHVIDVRTSWVSLGADDVIKSRPTRKRSTSCHSRRRSTKTGSGWFKVCLRMNFMIIRLHVD